MNALETGHPPFGEIQAKIHPDAAQHWQAAVRFERLGDLSEALSLYGKACEAVARMPDTLLRRQVSGLLAIQRARVLGGLASASKDVSQKQQRAQEGLAVLKGTGEMEAGFRGYWPYFPFDFLRTYALLLGQLGELEEMSKRGAGALGIAATHLRLPADVYASLYGGMMTAMREHRAWDRLLKMAETAGHFSEINQMPIVEVVAGLNRYDALTGLGRISEADELATRKCKAIEDMMAGAAPADREQLRQPLLDWQRRRDALHPATDEVVTRLISALRALRPDVRVSPLGPDRLRLEAPTTTVEIAVRPLRAGLHLDPRAVEQYAAKQLEQLRVIETSPQPQRDRLFPALRSDGQVAQLRQVVASAGGGGSVSSWPFLGALRITLALVPTPELVMTATSQDLAKIGVSPDEALALARKNLRQLIRRVDFIQQGRLLFANTLLGGSSVLDAHAWGETAGSFGGALLAIPVNRDCVVLADARLPRIRDELLAAARHMGQTLPMALPPTLLRWTPAGFALEQPSA